MDPWPGAARYVHRARAFRMPRPRGAGRRRAAWRRRRSLQNAQPTEEPYQQEKADERSPDDSLGHTPDSRTSVALESDDGASAQQVVVVEPALRKHERALVCLKPLAAPPTDTVPVSIRHAFNRHTVDSTPELAGGANNKPSSTVAMPRLVQLLVGRLTRLSHRYLPHTPLPDDEDSFPWSICRLSARPGPSPRPTAAVRAQRASVAPECSSRRHSCTPNAALCLHLSSSGPLSRPRHL
jgi:hypothetical protein